MTADDWGVFMNFADRHWHGAQNGLYGFMIETLHPDIDLFAPATQEIEAAMPALSLVAA